VLEGWRGRYHSELVVTARYAHAHMPNLYAPVALLCSPITPDVGEKSAIEVFSRNLWHTQPRPGTIHRRKGPAEQSLSKSRGGPHSCRPVSAPRPCSSRRQDEQFNVAPFGFALHFLHHWQRARTCADYQAAALPGYLLFHGQRRVSKGIAEFLGGFFLALADLPAVDHYVVLLGDAIDANGAE
jgi:hypothetical protein